MCLSKTNHWAQMLRYALSIGISPHEFWQLSVLEWKMLAGESHPALNRHEFEKLLKEFDNDTR
jgi:hypothetical protein